ncbi:hypothetical protein O181_106509 [Austropuccinia psidii MF-1]|uniref:Uncharacterized protein n=1 Tax=Austropuccinia psidii MF-1 TaxID=1389203 RepID=A0A9Q3PM48_9BASI|nr:hypothetical protein [Austropuccinia psidii MF-1]
MSPTRSGRNYYIQSNGSGPGHSSHKSKRQECQPRGDAQMEDARTSTSSQRLASTFDTFIESPEADITAIPVVRPELFPEGKNRDISVSVQELVYSGKAAGVGTSSKSLDRNNELFSSSEEAQGPRKDRRSSEGLDTHFLQGKSTKNKSLVEIPKHVVRGPEEEVGPRNGQQPSGSSSILHNCQTRASKPQREIRRASKRKRERQNPSGTSLATELHNLQKKEKTAMKNVFNMERTLMKLKNKEEERLSQSFPKK